MTKAIAILEGILDRAPGCANADFIRRALHLSRKAETQLAREIEEAKSAT